ncbi:MAG: histidine phosphatase family protein [Phycisphaerales bacterium]|nr:MAG: histidine phosphatase family protein [Phycisphaerales bacterium]
MARRQQRNIQLCLIRCGQTTWSAEQRLHGAVDLPLSPEGREAVANAAEGVRTSRIATVYHPDTEAAAETARAFARTVGAKNHAVAELIDPDLGLLEGLEKQVFAERFQKRFRQWELDLLRLAPPEGEPVLEARARVFAAIARIIRRSRSEEVAVVLGSLTLGLLRCRLADRPASDVWELLRNRPDVERYCLTAEQVKELETEARAEAVTA